MLHDKLKIEVVTKDKVAMFIIKRVDLNLKHISYIHIT